MVLGAFGRKLDRSGRPGSGKRGRSVTIDHVTINHVGGDANRRPDGARCHAGKRGKSPRHSWQQLAQWIDADPQTLATKVPCDRRDPFVVPRAEVVEEPLDDESETLSGPPPEELTPESLGMVLSSTMIGPRDRGARINGELYSQGDSIVVELQGQPIEFSLAEVHLRHVVLSRDDERFELKNPGSGRCRSN